VIDTGAVLMHVSHNGLWRLVSGGTEQQYRSPLCLAELEAAVDDGLERLIHTNHGGEGLGQSVNFFEFFNSSFQSCCVAIHGHCPW
jgi:hypothetical protein